MNPILRLVIVMACLGSLASCSSNNTPSGPGNNSTAPTVVSTVPASAATQVSVSTVISATFSKDLDPSTVTTSSFTLNNSMTGTVAYSNKVATFTPSHALAFNTFYTATLTTAIKDTSGTAMSQNYTWSFTTVGSGLTGKLLFVENYDLFIKDLSTDVITQLTSDSALNEDYEGQISPDGTKIVWQRYVHSPFNYDVWAMNPDGTGKTQIISFGQIADYACDPANRIVCTKGLYNDTIQLISLTGSVISTLAADVGAKAAARFSPNGTRVAYFKAAADYPDYKWVLYIMNSDGSNKIPVSDTIFGSAQAHELYCRWSPTGDRVAYAARSYVSSTDHSAPLKVYNVSQGTTVTMVNDIGQYSDAPDLGGIAWSKDGLLIFYCNIADLSIYSIPSSSGAAIKVSPSNSESPTVSFDGTKLAYVTGTFGSFQIVVSNLDGTSPVTAYAPTNAMHHISLDWFR